MKVGLALREVHRSETSLARRLRRIGERHKTDHDVFYLCVDLAVFSEQHIRDVAEAGRRYDVALSASPPRIGGALAVLREKTSQLVGRRPEPGLLLLADLRSVHVHAAAVSVDWLLLVQGAQVVRDAELLELASQCHADALRQMRWASTMLKELAPQVLAS